MVFHLAALPAHTFAIIRSIFHLHSQGQIKGQKLPRSKKTPPKPLHLKGSNFKCLRGIEPSVAESLLSEVVDGQLSFSKLPIQCQAIKQLGRITRIQAAFIKATNCETWDEAQDKFPNFTMSEKLEPF